jgi:hypothetical protein
MFWHSSSLVFPVNHGIAGKVLVYAPHKVLSGWKAGALMS